MKNQKKNRSHQTSVQDDSTWPVRWHRVRTVREREEISLSAFARRTRMPAGALRKLEDERNDLSISLLHRMAQGLGVPVSELLIESSQGLSEPIRQRACLVRIARTAHSLVAHSKTQAMRSLAQTIVNELTEIMPELAEVGSWPEFGTRRPVTDIPRILDRIVSGVPTTFTEPAGDWWERATLK